MSEQETKAGQPEQGAEGQNSQFHLQKIYLKDTSFETPNSPAVFTEKWDPDINIELNTSGARLSDDVHEVILTVTVTAKLGDKTAFLVEVHQAGVFTISGFAEQKLGHLLGSYCPGILFPYAREAISDIVAKGGFPQLLLTPVNFDALYAQHKQQASEEAQDPVH